MSTKSNKKSRKRSVSRRILEICIYAMLGTLMFCSKVIMEILPNIHLLGALVIVYTAVYRSKALIPIYVYVFINGLYAGFATWWIPYLYIWTILWAMTMLIPCKLPKKVLCILYSFVCCLHGLLFGVLYAPVQAIIHGFNLDMTLAWIASGFVFDILHVIGNFFAGLLIIPLSDTLKKLSKNII